MSERVDRVTEKFEDQFQTAVQFRLDDFLWEQESLKEQRLAMRSRLKVCERCWIQNRAIRP